MARCLRRKRLYDQHLVDVEQKLRRIAQQSDWRSRPGAFDDAHLRELMTALEDILDTYVVYGVESDMRRARSHGVFRRDLKRPPTLDDIFASPPPAGAGKSEKADKKTLPANKAYARYFEWFIQPTDGVKAFYERYPLLAHAVETVATHYGENIRLACDRVKKDWQDIERAFFPEAGLQHLARITSTGNDFHKGGKQVLILTFGLKDGGEGRVVYKPSAVEIDCRIVGDSAVVNAVKPGGYTQDRSLTEILNTYNPAKTHGQYTTKPLPTYVILPYDRASVEDAYGYIQFLTHEPELAVRPSKESKDVPRHVADAIAAAQTRGDVVAQSDWIVTEPKDAWDYCYQLGFLMAMALAVSLCDLHVQNAIAHARLPHLIDLEEALKRPMSGIKETMLHEVADQDSVGGFEQKIVNDDTTGFEVIWWEIASRTPAAATLYRYDPSQAAGERVSRVRVVGGAARRGAALDSAVLRYAVVRGLSDAVGALSSDEGHAKVKEWVAGLKDTLARFVPWATKNYAEKSRTLYWKFCTNRLPGAEASTGYRDIVNESGNRFFVEAAKPRRSEWQDRRKQTPAAAEWNPLFAVEHPDHAWKDYLNGDVPAFYHKLGSRDLLNSRGKIVDVAAADAWQVANLGVPPFQPELPVPHRGDEVGHVVPEPAEEAAQGLDLVGARRSLAREDGAGEDAGTVQLSAKYFPYFPKTPVEMVTAQLDALKAACGTQQGKRDYLERITTGITWLQASPVDNLLPRLRGGPRRTFPFADASMRALGDLVSDFRALDPLPEYSGKEEPAVRAMDFPDRDIDLIRPTAPPRGTFAYVEELKNIPFPRVVAYGFRGDSRKPLEFKAQVKDSKTGTMHEWMQGFLPNYARPGHNAAVEEFTARPDVVADPTMTNPQWIGPDGKKRSADEVDTGALDLRFYIANEFMGGYISLTRYAMVARSFACGLGGTPRSTPDAWVYCCLAEGAFNVPRKGAHAWAIKNEAELAMPGMVEWQDVVGFREVTKEGTFTGPVYLRRSLQNADRAAFNRLYQVLSGMNQ